MTDLTSYYVGGAGVLDGVASWFKGDDENALQVANKAVIWIIVLLVVIVILAVWLYMSKVNAEQFMPGALAPQQEFDGMAWSSALGGHKEGLDPGVERAKSMANMTMAERNSMCANYKPQELPSAWSYMNQIVREKDVASIPPAVPEKFDVGTRPSLSDDLLTAKLMGQ